MSDWTKSIKGAAPAAPTAPEPVAAPAVSPEKVRSVFGGSKPAPGPVEVSPSVNKPQAPARVVPTYDEPPMMDDAMKAALKAKAAETGAAIVSGIGKGASATFAKAKAMRAEQAPRMSAALAQLRQQPISRATKLVCGGVVALAVLTSAGIEFHAHRSVKAPTVATIAPKPAAPVAAHPFTPGVLVLTSDTAPTTTTPVAAAPVVAPTVIAAPAPATCTFTGTVQTAAGAPIAGATVAMDPRGSFRLAIATNAEGGFSFTNTPGASIYSLQVQAPGMRTVRLAMSPCVSGQVVVLQPVAVVAPAPVAPPQVRAAPHKASAPARVKAPAPAWQSKANSDLDAFFKHRH